MGRRVGRGLGGALAALLAAAAAAPASAEWPVARRDPRRTGASPNASDIVKPAQYWRSYLGGALGGFAFVAGDTDGDGALDVLYAAGGRLALARPDGEVLWQTAQLGVQAVADVLDLDGDGAREVIARGSGQALLIDGRSGALLWKQPAGELGTMSALRLADLDADGRLDLFVDRCGCCAVEGASPGEIYSFAGDLASPVKLGPLPARDHCNAAANTLGDWDGDGDLDLLLPTSDALMLATPSGQVLGTSAPIALYIGGARCEAANIDGQPGDEAVCLHNVGVGNQEGRRVFALGYRPGQSPPAALLWEQVLAPSVDGDLRAPGRLLWDLDADGAAEVVASGKDAAGTWTTRVLDAATGATEATLDGQLAQAVVPVPGATPWLVTSQGEEVYGWRAVIAPPTVVMELVWGLSGRRVPRQLDRLANRRSALAEDAVLVDLDGDGRRELLLEPTGDPGGLQAYYVGVESLGDGAAYTLDAGVGLVAAAGLDAVDAAARLAVSRDDGYLAILDGALATMNLLKEGNETLPGMRIGNYYTGSGALFTFGRAPIAGRLEPDAPAESALVVDARGDLVRVDSLLASNVSPARPTWRARDTSGASIARPSPGARADVAGFRLLQPITDPPSFALSLLDSEGAERFAAPLSRPPSWDVLPGDLDGDGTLDLVAMTVDSAAATEILAFRSDGAPQWTSPLTAQSGTSPLALADWDGDGADDVALAINTARVLAGQTGALLAESAATPFLAYFMPILLDVSGDGAPEMTLQGGLYQARTLSHDLQTPLWEGPDDRPYPYGAIAACGGVLTLVEGSLASTARLAITSMAGPSPGARATVVLAGGEVFPDEAAAEAAGAAPGQLGDVAVSANLSGADGTPTALVGSTDGFLYAVDACTGALRWSHRFDAPVGAPILSDTDGDGLDDIVVSVADGYLYGLRHEILPAPGYVWDVDVPRGLTAEDIDEIETESALYAAWAPVPGATTYELAVVGAAGTYLTAPAWVDVGAGTSATITGLPLEDGAKFYVGVRAVGPAGKGPDRPSDGVIVRLRPGADEPGRAGEYLLWGRGCACSLGGAGEEAAGLGAAVVLLSALGARRRSRRRRGPAMPGLDPRSAP